jgi:hypothetical protein
MSLHSGKMIKYWRSSLNNDSENTFDRLAEILFRLGTIDDAEYDHLKYEVSVQITADLNHQHKREQ